MTSRPAEFKRWPTVAVEVSMAADPTAPRYSRAEMLDDMVDRGLDFSASAFRGLAVKGAHR